MIGPNEGYRYRTDPKTKKKLTFLKGTKVIQGYTRIMSNIMCKLLILLPSLEINCIICKESVNLMCDSKVRYLI